MSDNTNEQTFKTQLTEDEKEMLAVVREDWIDISLRPSTERIKLEDAEAFTAYAYKLSDLEPPTSTFVARSPFEARKIHSNLSSDTFWEDLEEALRNKVAELLVEGEEVTDEVLSNLLESLTADTPTVLNLKNA